MSRTFARTSGHSWSIYASNIPDAKKNIYVPATYAPPCTIYAYRISLQYFIYMLASTHTQPRRAFSFHRTQNPSSNSSPPPSSPSSSWHATHQTTSQHYVFYTHKLLLRAPHRINPFISKDLLKFVCVCVCSLYTHIYTFIHIKSTFTAVFTLYIYVQSAAAYKKM